MYTSEAAASSRIPGGRGAHKEQHSVALLLLSVVLVELEYLQLVFSVRARHISTTDLKDWSVLVTLLPSLQFWWLTIERNYAMNSSVSSSKKLGCICICINAVAMQS